MKEITPTFTSDSVRTQFIILAVAWWIGYPLSIIGFNLAVQQRDCVLAILEERSKTLESTSV
jgi:hypothetical protein